MRCSRLKTEETFNDLAAACALSFSFGTLAISSAPTYAAAKERTALSKECSAKADAQNLHGKERKVFRSKCKREGPTAAKKS